MPNPNGQRAEPLPTTASQTPSSQLNLPIVRVSAAERAEKTRKGLFWYCDDAWSRTHACSKRFLALMGADDEETCDDKSATDEESDVMLITGDVSSLHTLASKTKPRAIRLTGIVNGSNVVVLIDDGSTHNFISPTLTEKLSLSLHPITPFRVFVGNGASLKFSFVCFRTPLCLQGHDFEIDLFILQVEGADVILGVQWLQDLGDVTKNYRKLTMQFQWEDRPILLCCESPRPTPISYNVLFLLLGQESSFELFELVLVTPSDDSRARKRITDPLITEVLEQFTSVFFCYTNRPTLVLPLADLRSTARPILD